MMSNKHIKVLLKTSAKKEQVLMYSKVYAFFSAGLKQKSRKINLKSENSELFSKHRRKNASTKCQAEIRGRCVKNNLILWDICLMYLWAVLKDRHQQRPADRLCTHGGGVCSRAHFSNLTCLGLYLGRTIWCRSKHGASDGDLQEGEGTGLFPWGQRRWPEAGGFYVSTACIWRRHFA